MFHALWHPPLAYATDFIIQWLANLASPLPLRHLQCPGALASHLPMGIPRNPVVPCEVRYDWIRIHNPDATTRHFSAFQDCQPGRTSSDGGMLKGGCYCVRFTQVSFAIRHDSRNRFGSLSKSFEKQENTSTTQRLAYRPP